MDDNILLLAFCFHVDWNSPPQCIRFHWYIGKSTWKVKKPQTLVGSWRLCKGEQLSKIELIIDEPIKWLSYSGVKAYLASGFKSQMVPFSVPPPHTIILTLVNYTSISFLLSFPFSKKKTYHPILYLTFI